MALNDYYSIASNLSNADPQIRILLATDTPEAAHSIAAALSEANSAWVIIDICLSGRETLDKAPVVNPDIIIIDLNIRGISGLDVIRLLREKKTDIQFICIDSKKDYSKLLEAMKLGARGYFPEPLVYENLISAVTKTAMDIAHIRNMISERRYLLEKVESALRIIRKDYLKILLPDANPGRKLVTYATFLGIAEQPGFMTAFKENRKKPSFQGPETIIYRLSTQFDLISTSIQPGLAIAFFPTENLEETCQMDILTRISRVLVNNNDSIICGAGRVYSSALEMKDSLSEAFAALNHYNKNKTQLRQCVIYDPEIMKLPTMNNNINDVMPAMGLSLDKAVEYIKANYQRELPLGEVASYINLSPSYFSRVFKKYTGDNFSKYLLKLRIDKAKELLADKNNSIKSVAFQVGFNDPNYFSKVFHDLTGMKASDFE